LIESSISVPLNPYNPLDGRFDLYYFVKKARNENSRKTVLYIAGGPGEFVMPSLTLNTFVDFLATSGYNVAFFHLRGTGFSQIPPQSQYDKYLTTSYAVEDIEEIRQDLVRQQLLNDEGKWDAIIAWSYGTVLAQQYTFAHEASVEKLILFAPLSRHNVASAGRQFREQTQYILRDNLEKIYSPLLEADPRTPDPRQREFSDLTPGQKDTIFSTLFGGTDKSGVFDPGVIERTEAAFGSINFVFDRYSDLRKRGELHRYNLDRYSCSFFEKLYQLRLVGWLGSRAVINLQMEIAAKIRDEIINAVNVSKDDCSNALASSARVFYAMGALDGINIRFVREWLANGRSDVRDALRRSAGDAHVKRSVNEYVEKLGVSDEHMINSSHESGLPTLKTEWDPAKYKHRRPTLILKGEADPVTVGDQAEYFHSEALLGPRLLITFPGIGHAFELPETNFQQRLHGMIKLQAKRFSPGQLAEIAGTISGFKLNRNLNLRLSPPHDLEPGLKLVGFGRTAGEARGRGDIVALIQNTSGNEVRGSKRLWKLESEFFTGKIEIDTGRIAKRETKDRYGKIIDSRPNESYRVRVKPPSDWDAGLKPLCTQLGRDHRGNKVTTLVLNQGSTGTSGKIGRWMLYNDYFSTDFFFGTFSKPLVPNAVSELSINPEQTEKIPPAEARWSLQSKDKDDEACAPPREDLSKALAQEVHCDVPIVLNIGPTKSSSEKVEKTWEIEENPVLAVTISSRLESCVADGDPRVVRGVTSLKLKDWVEVREPSTSQSQGDFDLLGYNILDEGRISLVLRNKDSAISKSVGDTGRDWSYALVPQNTPSPCESFQPNKSQPAPGLPARGCLIFSYLVMDPTQYNSVDSNIFLRDIASRFRKEIKTGIGVDPRPGGILIPGLK
jgi:pimeloyl-ACP methyl ester carboxylesterase